MKYLKFASENQVYNKTWQTILEKNAYVQSMLSTNQNYRFMYIF